MRDILEYSPANSAAFASRPIRISIPVGGALADQPTRFRHERRLATDECVATFADELEFLLAPCEVDLVATEFDG